MNRRAIHSVLSFALVCASVVPAVAAAEGSFQRTLKVSGPVNMELSTGSGNIIVSTSVPKSLPGCVSDKHFSAPSDSQVQVIGCIRATDWFGNSEEKVRRIEANPPILQSGNDIRIGHIDDPSLRNNVSISYLIITPPHTMLHSHTGSGDQLIRDLREMIEVSSGSGSLKVDDIGDSVRANTGSGNIEIRTVRGSVRAKTGSGSIQASDIAGGFEGSTGSGGIRLEQTAAGAVRVDTGSGNLELSGVHGSLQATAGSGDIQVDGSPTGTWTLHTGSGSIRMQTASSASFNLHAHSGSGQITVRQPLTVEGTLKRQDVTGKVRGGGVPVELESGSGDIEIK